MGYITRKYFKLKSAVLEVKFSKDTIFIIDAQNIIYIFDNSFTLLTKTRLTKDGEQKHPFCNAFSISTHTIAIPAENILALATYKERIIPISRSNFFEENIIFTTFCQNDTYILSADTKGKVHIFNHKTKTTRYVFNNQADYCSYAIFSSQNKFLFVSYFNKKNILLNLTNDIAIDIDYKHPIELASFFDDDKKLFMADRYGNSIIYDCVINEIIHCHAIFTQWVTQVVLSINKQFLIIATRDNHVYLLNPFTNTIIKTLELEDYGVTSMDIAGNILILGFTNATIITIDLENKKDEFALHLKLEEYQKVKEILEYNSFLYTDELVVKFKLAFNQVLDKAKCLITKNEHEQAITLVAPFMDFEECKKSFDTLFLQNDIIASFAEVIEINDISKAYALANKYHIIQSLGMYEILEKQWEITFAKAKKILEEDPLRGKDTAKKILSTYENIPQKKSLIQRLLFDTAIFSKAETYIKHQKFEEYFMLVKQFSFLKETLLYAKVDNLAKNLYTKALNYQKENNMQKARTTYISLLLFPKYAQNATTELKHLDLIHQFENFIASEDIQNIYTLIEKHMFLTFLPIFEQFHKKFEKVMENAIEYRDTGNIASAVCILKPYLQIKELQMKIDNCMKIGYLKQLEDKNFHDLARKSLLEKYNYLFGLDNSLKTLFQKKGFQDEYQEFQTSPTKISVTRYPDSLD